MDMAWELRLNSNDINFLYSIETCFESEDKIEICIKVDKLYFQIDANFEILRSKADDHNV